MNAAMNPVERAHHTYPFGDGMTGYIYPAGDRKWAMVIETDEHVLVDELHNSFLKANDALWQRYAELTSEVQE